MARVPIVFGDARRLTGFYHPPDGSRVRSQAVVLCNPLGYEAMSVHRTYRHLAERLASSGFPVLRFDYHGTGDSPAPSNHSGGPAAWVESIRSAAGEARRLSGAERLALVGTGFGASLAATAAARMADVESLVLWAPVVSGRAYARALRAFRLFKYSDAGPAPRNDGGEEIAGYFFSRETLAAFAEIDLLRLASLPRRALVLGGGDDPEAEAQLVED